MTDQQEKEFGFEEDDDVFHVEDLDAEQDPVPEFEAFASEPATGAAASAAAAGTFADLDDEPLLEDDGEPVTAVPERKSSRSRILVMVLLLVLVAAGAFFFLGGEEEPPPVAKLPVPQNKPVAIPRPPSEPAVVTEKMAPVAEQGQPVAEPVAPVAATPPVVAKPAVAQPQAEAVTPVKPEVAEKPQPAATVAKPVEPVAKPAVAEAATAAPATEVKPEVPAPSSAAAPVAVNGDYRVQVGAYVLPTSLHEVESRLQQLGYQPQVITGSRTLSMIRLFYGRYPASQGAAELAGLKKTAPDAFLIHDGDQVDLYAGSYVSLDKARRFADLLFEKQVKVDERSVEVPIPFYRVSVGPLPDHQAAEEVLARLKREGLEGLIVKQGREAESSPQ